MSQGFFYGKTTIRDNVRNRAQAVGAEEEHMNFPIPKAAAAPVKQQKSPTL